MFFLCNNKVNIACSNTYALRPKSRSTFAPKTGWPRSVPLQLVGTAWAAAALPQWSCGFRKLEPQIRFLSVFGSSWRTKFGSIKWARKWVHVCTPILSLTKEIETWVQIWVRNMDPRMGHRTRTKTANAANNECQQRCVTSLRDPPRQAHGRGTGVGNQFSVWKWTWFWPS